MIDRLVEVRKDTEIAPAPLPIAFENELAKTLNEHNSALEQALSAGVIALLSLSIDEWFFRSALTRHAEFILGRVDDWFATRLGRFATGGKEAVLGVMRTFDNSLVQYFVEQNIALIKSMDADAKSAIRAVLRQAELNNLTERETKKLILEKLKRQTARARFIAGDQAMKLIIARERAIHISAGMEEYEWETRKDDRVRSTHRAMQGRIIRWDTPPPIGHVGTQPGCRCRPKGILNAT